MVLEHLVRLDLLLVLSRMHLGLLLLLLLLAMQVAVRGTSGRHLVASSGCFYGVAAAARQMAGMAAPAGVQLRLELLVSCLYAVLGLMAQAQSGTGVAALPCRLLAVD
jgi:hypothetical protein